MHKANICRSGCPDILEPEGDDRTKIEQYPNHYDDVARDLPYETAIGFFRSPLHVSDLRLRHAISKAYGWQGIYERLE